MADRNLVLQLILTAKDEISGVFGNVFGFVDRTTSATANLIREKFADLFGGGISGAADFEAQLDRVAAKGGYTAAEMGDVAQAVREIGAKFGISGTEAAKGMETLAAAGLSAKDAVGALPSVLALATSEQISAGAAAEKLVDSLSIMGLGFDQAGRMADVLAKGADITTSSTAQLSEALSETGGTARAAGMDLESTVAALDLLHKNGLKGSEAGTALKAILTALLDPSSKASQELNKLGITSRDLGTVLDGIKNSGDKGSAAILAFGTEAGPGLRALISEGKTGLDEYTGQLRNAEGAAAGAASQMGGNLKGAWDALTSAWDSLKQALVEPLLAPIAQQARDLGAALQEGLSSESFKKIQDAVRSFGENSAQAIREFVESFDFEAAANKTAEFVSNASQNFDKIGQAGGIAADAIKIAWNGVTLVVQGVATVLAGFTAAIATSFEGIVTAMAQVGLVSDGTAQSVATFAEQSRQYVTQLREGVITDAKDIGDGIQSMAGRMDAARGSAKALSETPIAPDAQLLEPIKKSLADYAGILELAKRRQEEAARAANNAQADFSRIGELYVQGRGSLAAYTEAKARDTTAQAALQDATVRAALAQSDFDVAVQNAIRGISAESQAVTSSLPKHEDRKTALLASAQAAEQNAKAAGDQADAIQSAANAVLNGIKADIDKANALGQTTIAQQKTIELAKAEAEWASVVAAAKQAEIAAQIASNQAKLASLAAGGLKTEAEKQEYAALALKNAALGMEGEALQKGVAAKEAAAKATGNATQATQANTAATAENAAATDQAAESAGSLAGVIASLIDYWRQKTAALSESTKALFEYNAGLSKIDPSAGKESLGGLSEEAAKAGAKLGELTAFIRQMDAQMLNSTGSVGRYMDMIQRAGAIAERSYYEQKLQAEQLETQLAKVGETGGRSFASVAAAMSYVTGTAATAKDALYLLNEQDMDQLQAAIDGANDKLREMQQETQDAKDRLAEMNAELLEAEGMDQKAKLLREQLEYAKSLAEIESQMQQAQMEGNRDLIAILEQQRDTLERIHAAREANIRAEDETKKATDKTRESLEGASNAAEHLERIHNAMRGIAGTDLSRLHGQFTGLRDTAFALRDAL